MLEGVKSDHAVEVVWDGDRRYRGGVPGGTAVVVDGERKVGPSPVDTVLIALGSCSAIDVVDYLEKRRAPASAVSVQFEFSRAPSPPRRLTEIRAHFRVTTAAERHHVERAIELSFEKYCSVSASLAPDTDLSWTLELTAADAEGGG